MNRCGATSLALSAAVLAGLAAGWISSHAAPVAPEEPARFAVSGTIRWVDSETWIALNDAGHRPSGIASVEPLADRVRVTYSECAEKVGHLQATPDEQFAAAGVRVGASVGLCYADVFFYMGASDVPVNPGLLSRQGANVWLSGEFDRVAQ